MVRETRYLLVGNLPETTTEDEITEYFKRFGKIQKVKLERKPDGSSDSDEKEEGCITSLTATVAFTDIKSASNAHKAEKKIGNNVLSSEYSSGFGATGSVVKRTHEPEIFPRAPPPPGPFPPRKGFEEEDGFDAYYGPTPIYSEPSYPGSPFPERGRPRERWVPGGPIPGRGAKWMPGPSRQFSDSGKDAFEKPKTASVPASSPASHTSSKRSKKKKKSKSTERSRSRSSASNSSRSSSSDSESGSQSSSKERGKSAVASMGGKDPRDSEIEPGEREPLGILIRKLPLRSSDTSLRDGLFHEYKKYGKITAVQVSGANENRYAIISFKQAEDAAKALNASGSKRFFGSQIVAEQHEGLEGEDGDFLTPEAQLDEHSPKATRTLFLGNLDKEITIEELKERLEKYGDILDVDVKRQGAITAYAFIQFTDITSVVKALKDLDGTTWGATKLKVGFGKSMATPVVWLGNLADTVHEGFLFKQFARFGALSHTVVDRENHKGLVFFMNVESAQYALPEMRNRIWNGKKIHIDYASRDCQESFYKKMEQSGQLRPGERPDARSMQKKLAENPHWEEGGFDPNFKSRGGFNQFGRGRGRFQRGRGGFFRGRGGPSFEGPYPPDEFALRKRQLDEYSQGSSQFIEDDYEKALRDYNKSQRERHERSSQSPPPYDDMYYERTSQSGHDYDQYEKHRFASYRSASPGSDREIDIADEEFRYKRTPSDERYSYYKEKIYEEGRVRERSHSSDSEQHYRLPSEILARRSRSRSPTLKDKRKDLPISYRSHTPPTPTEEEGYYPSDNSPTDFDSAYRKKYKRPSSGSVEGDRKSGVLVNTGLRREIESKSEERASRKRSYDQLSPKRSDSYRIERQLSRGSRADSLHEFEKLSAKELIAKVQRLRAEVNERLGVKDSPSSSSNSDIDPSTLTESDLLKLHSEKQMLLQKLTLFDESGNLSGNDSDSRHRSSKKPRVDLKYLQAKQEKRHKIREYKKSKSASDVKKDFMEYSEEDSFSVNSPRDFPPGLMPKKRRKVDSESDRKSRSYRARHDDDQAGFSSDEEKDRNDVLRQSSAHGDAYSKSRTSSSLDARLESAEFSSHSREESRRVSSGSDNNKEHSEHLGHSRRRHKKRDNHITPLIPLGDDSMPDPETTDPRPRCEKCERPMELLLPDFAQFIQFSPLPSPHHSPERCSDLRPDRGRDKMSDTAYQSPCFSPQSSSSKTHSPSQSPSGSGSDTKANTNSDSGSGEIPLGFPKEPEQIDPEANKVDSLDSVPDPSKSPEKSKQNDDSFSDNNSDIENLNADNLSIEERIRQLDEKWNKAQAVAAATPKVVPDVDNLVNSVASGSPLLTPFTAAPVMATASASPTTSSLYSKFRIRKRNDATGSGTDKGDGPSEIVQTVLSKSSIFDQDSKRLGQHDDLLDSNKETSPTNGNSPKLSGAWNKPEVKEISPMVTLPGSLLDRLGPGNNGSFPTLPLNTPFSSATSVSMCRTDSFNQNVYTCDSRISKLSPLPSLDIPIVNDKIGLSLSPLSKDEKLLQKVENDITGNSPKIEKNGLGLDSDSKKKDPEKSPVMPKSILKNRSNSDISSIDTNIFENGTDSSVKEENSYIKTEKKGDDTNLQEEDNKDKTVNSDQKLDLNSPKINGDIVKIEKEECEVSETKSDKSAKLDKESLGLGDRASLSSSKIKDESTSSTSIKTEAEENKTSNDVKPIKKETIKAEDEKMETDEIKSEHKLESAKEEIKPAVKTENSDVKMEVDPPQDNVKVEQSTSSSKSPSRDKHSSKSSSKDSTSKEPSHKKQKLSKDGKEKRSDSSHKDDKHKKKDSDKKSESSHKSSSEKKDEKHKDKHKSKSDKEKKDGDKKVKDEKKENKDKKKTEKKDKDKKDVEKDVKDDKSDKHSKEKKEEKVEDKKPSSSKEEENKDSKEKSVEKKEKSEKKHEKKEGHKHDKHSTKSPDKKSKSSQKKEEPKVNKESEEKPKESPQKESTPKEGTLKESEKDKKDIDKEKQDKDKSDKKSSESSSSSKKEHRSSSSHKSKKSKDEASSSTKSSKEDSKTAKSTKLENSDIKKSPKEEDSKKVKDDHSEHKKKDEASDRNNKDSPDKNKDANRKESADKKSSEKTKEKSNGGDKCKEDNTKNKEKENKDKDPDHSKSKGNGNNPSTSSEPVEKPKSQLSDTAKTDKTKTETDKDESKKSESKKDDSKKDDKKANKDTDMFKNLNAFTKKSSKDTEIHKKSSQKIEKSGKSKEEKKESKSKDKSDTDSKSKKDSSKHKKKEEPVVYNGLTEEDLAIFAKFADESSLSMYAKVKRRSTEKKLHHDKETEEQKKLLSEYKKNQKCNKKLGLSDITESSEVSSDEENRMKSTPKNRKKFAFSSDDSESSTDTGADILQKKNKAKIQAKKPKRILDIYSSDSEEEEMGMKTPSKSSSSTKKKKADVHRENDNKFEFDSISDSDNKSSATQQAKVKTKPKTEKKQSKTKSDSKSQPKHEKKEDQKPKKPKLKRKDLSFKDLFSDDSDDSMLSDSDSDSDIMISSKAKKNALPAAKTDKNKKILPRGSSIYTSSEDSGSDEGFKPMSPPKSTMLPKKNDKKVNNVFKSPTRKDPESDSMTSDTEVKNEKNKKMSKKNCVQNNYENSLDSDSFISEPEISKTNEVKVIPDLDKSLKKIRAEKSREQIEKDLHKFNNNKKIHDIITDDPRYSSLSKLDIAKVYSETVYEKDSLLSNLTNKNNLPPILTDINKEPLFKLDADSVRNDIPTLKDINLDDKSSKIKNKKHKKENKKKKKNKEKSSKDSVRDISDGINSKYTDLKQEIQSQKHSSSENLMQDSDLENLNAVNRNLFDDLKGVKSPEGKRSKNKKESKSVAEKEEHLSQPERLTDSDFTDSEKKKTPKSERPEQGSVSNKEKPSDVKKSLNSDVFDFQEEENKVKPIKESHMKVIKPDAYDVHLSDHEPDNASNVPVEIQGVEIEYRSEEQDYKDEGFNICPVVETTEVVIENVGNDSAEKEKPKPRKKKGRRNSGKDNDLTEEAVSSLNKEDKADSSLNTANLTNINVQFEAPVSNENELIIDEGASLHVEDETEKAVESICNDETDETAKAVESILMDGIPGYTISEPVEPTPTLDQNYLQPDFAPSLPNTVPQVGTEVETATTNSPLRGKKGGRKGKRTKSGQSDILIPETPINKPFDLLGDSSLASDLSTSLDQNDDDDDDDGKLQIDFDPPKPELKQKKPRKPKQTKVNKMNDAAALAAENKLDNLFGNFTEEKKDELNRDSLSSENSELERSKHEDLLFIDREDQRHDSDLMSPDERSTSDDLTSPDLTKPKPKRGRKPKNKEQVTATIPRTNSPRANSRTLSPRSPRNNFDPKSPEPKLNGPKNLIIDEGNKLGTNVFDFDENDESNSNISSTPTTTGGKQRKPRQKKKGEPGLQSPESRSLFSSPENNDRLIIGSPESKGMFSPEHKAQIPAWDKKALFSPNFQHEEQKLEVKNVADDKPPEPLFKAFFEAKSKTEKDADKANPLLARKGVMSPKDGELKTAANAKVLSNVDKTIEDVSKGLFESTDDEGTNANEQTTQKKRQVKKNKEDDIIKSPLRSPLPKSPLKSPVMNHMHSPPPSMPTHQQPLVLPGMGIGQPTIQAPIGEPQVAGPISMYGPMSSPPPRTPVSELAKGVSIAHSSPIITSALLSPNKSMGVMSVAQTTSVTSVLASTTSVAQDLRKMDGATESMLKSSMPGFLIPGISASTAVGVLQGIATTSSTAPTSVVTSSMSDPSKHPPPPYMENLTNDQQQQQQQAAEQQKLLDQKQAELQLQRQQEHHVKLKEMELKKQMEHKKMLEEQHKKLQEQMKTKEIQEQQKREEMMKKEQEKKRLEEHFKMLHEQLQKQQALAAGIPLLTGAPPGQQELLSPGSLQRQRPGLPSPSADKGGPRPPVSAHHQMPAGAQFGLPGALQIRPGQFPPHLTPAQIQVMQQHLVSPLGSDKPPTNAELALKHQQLQQQIVAQAQKAQAQAIAEQQAQLAKQQATQSKQGSQQVAQGKAGKGATAAKKAIEMQHPPTSQGMGVPVAHGKDGGPLPGSQEAANQLTAQIKQQLAMQQAQQQAQAHASHQSHPGSHGGPQQGPQGVGSWPVPHRQEGPRQPGPPQGPILGETRSSMPGPVPVIGGNPQQVQRVSPNPPNKSPTVAQTAPNMVLGFSQHQTAAPRAPSPAVAKTAVVFPQASERQTTQGKWPGGAGQPRPSPPDVRPRPPSSESGPPASRPDIWGPGVNGPVGMSMNATPRPAHQQQPDTLQLKRVLGAPDRPPVNEKFLQQQHEKHFQELQRQEFLKHQQEIQRQQQLRDQALHAQAQKEVQIHKEREEREKREAQANQVGSDPRQSPAIRMGYPFVEPRPPSRDGGKMQQSPAIVDPRDPRFSQAFPGHHPDLRMGSSQASAFSPAAGNSGDPSHMYTQAELQRIQNGLIPAYPPSLLMRDPHLIPGHAPPYMLPGHLAYMAQQIEHQHLVDGRPPSRGTSRPPSNQPVHTVSPTQQAPGDRNQNRGQGQTMGPPSRDPHPGDGSLLSLLQRYPVMWQGVLGLKNDQCVVQMHFISGFQPLVKMSLPQQAPDGTVQPLRIAQRMRLEQAQLEGVAKRMQMEKDYCMMLALPCGRDHTDIYQQTRAMSTGFIQYLQQKQAAGIVNVADPGSQQPAYVVHIFPPCDFSQTTLSRLGFDLLYQVKDLAHLIVIIATVA